MEQAKQREKLIDLIINAKRADPETGSFAEFLADFLLGYGVIVPGDDCDVDHLRETMQKQAEYEEFMERWKDAVALAGAVKEVGADRVAELVQADIAGRCVVLPCKEGDVVWFTRAWYSILNKPLEGRVTSIREVHGTIASFEATVTGIGPAVGSSRRFDSDMIGKTVFLDYTEAEAALEKAHR